MVKNKVNWIEKIIIDMSNLKKIKEQLRVHYTQGAKYKRFGSDNDGGYVMVDDISNKDFIISCGIGDDVIWSSQHISWEKDMFDICKEIHLYECAIDGIDNMPSHAKFFKCFVGKEIFLKDMIDNAGKHDDYILKVDIEGGEWDLFYNSTSLEINNFRQIVLELHNIPYMIKNNFKKIYSVLSKINKTHRLMFINTNNWGSTEIIDNKLVPTVVEVLFLRKDSYNFVDIDYPNELLRPCSEERDDLELFFR